MLASIATVPVIGQENTDRERLLTLYERLVVIGGEVCITDPCPVEEIQIEFMGQSHAAVKVELPGQIIYFIRVDEEQGVGRGGLYSCSPQNYVEVSPAITCTQLA